MADNVAVDNGALTDYNVAADLVTYSGDADRALQLIRPVMMTGAEGSKTVVEIFRAEDTGHTTGDIGLSILAVRNDANASLSDTDLDYTPLSTDGRGNQNVITRRGLVRVAATSSGLTTAATAYAVGDQVGDEFTFAGCARNSGGGGYITGVSLISIADTIGAMDLLIFKQSVAAVDAGNDVAISFTDANVTADFVALIQMAGAFDIGANRICQAHNLAIPYTCGTTSLFGILVTRFAIPATPFAAVTDIQINLYVEPN